MLSESESLKYTLQDYKNQYNAVFQNCGTAMLYVDEDTTIFEYNQKFLEITGYSDDDIKKKAKWVEIILPDDKMMFLNSFRNHFKDQQKQCYDYQLRILSVCGAVKNLQVKSTAIPGTAKVLLSLIDISDHIGIMTALRTSERKYRDLYENANDILYSVDMNGYLTSANSIAFRTYGYTPEEIVNLPFRSLIDEASLALVDINMQEKLSKNSKSSTYEILTYTKNKTPVWLEINTSLIVENDVIVGVQGIGRDITERKKSEEQLRESQRRFKETADLLPGIICEMDTNLYLTYVNEIGFKLFGYSVSDFEKGVCVRDLIASEYREKFETIVSSIFNGQISVPSVYALYKKDNSLIYVLLSSAAIIKNGTITGIRTCFFDISPRVYAEEKLRFSEERFRTIYSESPIGIALFSPDGFLIDMNQSFCRLFGISSIANNNVELFKFINLNSSQLKKLKTFETVNLESEYDKNDNSAKIYLDWYLTPIVSQQDSGTSVYLVQVQDITERKKALDARIKQEREATARAEELVAGLKRELREKASFHNMVSRSAQMMQIFDSIPEIAQTSVTVLICGDSGTGKELIARSLHELSNRKDKPFIAINCSALPDSLLESELFGYKAGAFTDAKKDKPGKFSLAEGGTIFLDEIGDISAAMQVKLLRVLQEKVYEPLGGTKSQTANVRIIAATNKSLTDMVRRDEFREDLYYRINVITIKLPPLTERRCDIPLLAELFIERFNNRYGKKIIGINQETMETLLSYDFPGNIRELENIIEHAFVFCKESTISLRHLPEYLNKENEKSNLKAIASIRDFAELERMYLKSVLEDSNGCKIKAAAKLGIHKTTLFRKLKQLGIQ